MQVFKLKVGDKLFHCSKTNLLKAEYFDSLLTRWNIKDEIVLDDDPRLFRHFLNYLRYDTYAVPNKYKENIGKLFQYYGVKFRNIDIKPDELEMWKTKNMFVCSNPRTETETKTTIDVINKMNSMNVIYRDKNEVKYTFFGIFRDISFAVVDGTILLTITYNGTIIYDEKLHFTFQYQGTSFNKSLIHNIDDLEGEFKISVRNTNNWLIISYFEKYLK